MPRYQLDDYCLFVDATNFETNKREPKEIPYPHILDQRTTPATYMRLNDGAAYITRFIVLGVNTSLIPEILRSEYQTLLGSKVNTINFEAEVVAVLNMIDPYLKKGERHVERAYESPKQHGAGKHVDLEGKPLKGYDLDFRVNWFVVGCCKIPF